MPTSVPKSNASLRTKTGCLTCRLRRKKCNEARPICSFCSRSSRECVWPSVEDLVDGRNGRRRTVSPVKTAKPDVSRDTTLRALSAEASIVSAAIGTHLEVVVGQHFTQTYYSLLINPESHPDFYDDWINDIQASMTGNVGLRYSVLANAASNLFLAGEAAQMQEVALSYYSRSLRGLTQAVAQASSGQVDQRNSILTSVMMLYLHGCMGHGTYADIPMHVNAAVRMIRLSFLSGEQPMTLTRPYDRLAVESVIYQVYLVRMGLWSEPPGGGLIFDFDPQFWLSCEALLARSALFPAGSNTHNSPVLGLPFVLYKIMLMLKSLSELDRHSKKFRQSMQQLQDELHPWETWLRGDRDNKSDLVSSLGWESTATASEEVTRDATALMALSASLISLHISTRDRGIVPAPLEQETWQSHQIVSILRRRTGDRRWTACYLGNYPLYVAGYFMRTREEIGLVRREMEERSKHMASSQVHRFWGDLESTWQSREGGGIMQEEDDGYD